MGSGKKKLKKFEGYIFREDIYIIMSIFCGGMLSECLW